jgi:hypothetical protein
MGRSYCYECSKCGYRATVSGRMDRGVNFWVQTITCQQCAALYDSVTRLRVPEETLLSRWRNASGFHRRTPIAYRNQRSPPSFAETIARLPFAGSTRYRWLQFRLQCPISPSHQVKPWAEPGKCPKCGLFLERGALPYRLWD